MSTLLVLNNDYKLLIYPYNIIAENIINEIIYTIVIKKRPKITAQFGTMGIGLLVSAYSDSVGNIFFSAMDSAIGKATSGTILIFDKIYILLAAV